MLNELWSDLRYRIRALLRRADLERDLDAELQFHLHREAEKYERAGMPPTDARRRARLLFGGVDRAKEQSRDARGTVLVETLIQDLRYAVRGLRAKPGFTAGVVLTLGLGIGATVAMFSIIDRLLVRPPAYLRDADKVQRIYLSRVSDRRIRIADHFQFPRYRDLMRWSHSFSQSAAFVTWQIAIGDGQATQVRPVHGATASYFEFFDAPPALGRYYTAGEDSIPSGAPVAVLGYRFWQEALGGRRDILGTTLRVDHTLCTIIGVAPSNFRGFETSRDPAVYIPLATFGMDARGPSYVNNYGFHWLGVVVRRKPDVSLAAATADLTQAYRRSWIAQAIADGVSQSANTNLQGILAPVQESRAPDAGPESKVATWASGVTLTVLLIACANVANLLLARALVRRREIALRRALGVSRGRLIQQLLTETLLLATIGGIIGVLLAQWGGALLRSIFLPPDLTSTVVGDARTLLVAFAATLLAAALTGLVPALHSLRTSLSATLTSAGRDTSDGSSRARATLLVVQAALSVLLLVGAGLFVRSLQRVRALRLGYDVDPVLVVTDNTRGVKLDSAARIALERRLIETAETVPGVLGASVVSSVPFWGFEGRGLYVAGIDSVDLLGNFDLQAVSAHYFKVVGTRLIRGRGFDARDNASAAPVTIISEGMAKALWPGQDPLGKCFRIESPTAPCTTVIGLAEDLHLHSLMSAHEFIYYLPIDQFALPTGMLFVRVSSDASGYVETVRRRLQQSMPGASYVTVRPFRELVDPAMRSWRIGATMFVAFGAVALALAAFGLYSVIAYGVAQRRREIGVRIALGATPRSVVQLVLSGGLRLIGTGLFVGTGMALLASRGIADLLFQETPNDPAVYVTVAVVLVVVTVIATAAPAVGAARVDPNLSLRDGG